MNISLHDYSKVSQVLKHHNAQRHGILKDLVPILRHYNAKRYGVLNNFIPMSKKRNETLQRCKEDLDKSFNIFRDLAIDSKFNEVDHSKMLIKILSSDTLIGDEEYLNIFIKLIENIKGSKIDHHFDKKFKVEKEVGRTNDINESGGIDILISDNDYCIIIENKITDKAPDLENQLARYYKIAQELKKEPVAIVYIPFYYRIPPLCNYTGEYKELVNTIEKLLVILPAWDPKNFNDLTHGFLDKCSEYAKSVKNNMTAAVCLDQYSKFIKGKGDLEQMARNEDKEFIKQILSDADMRKTVEDIVEIWNARQNSIGELLLDYLIEKHKFKKNTTGLCGEMINDDIFIYFSPYKFQFGFGSITNTMPQDIQDDLKKILENDVEFIKFEGAYSNMVYGYIMQDIFIKNPENLENMYKYLSQKLVEYEERVSKILSVSHFA
jgi:hypothetical protein